MAVAERFLWYPSMGTGAQDEEEGGHWKGSTRMAPLFTGGRVVKAQGQLLKADMGGRAKNSPWTLSRTAARTWLMLSTHKNFCLWLLAGQSVNKYIAKSTGLLSRVWTNFECCQLPLMLTQTGLGWAGLGVGEERLNRGQQNACKLVTGCSESRKKKYLKLFKN